MKKIKHKTGRPSGVRRRSTYLIILCLFTVTIGIFNFSSKVSAACSPPSTTYGTDTMSVSNNTGATQTYTVWTRLQIPSSANDSIMLQVDGGNCYNVGGNSGLSTNTWDWVDYADGDTTVPIQVSLTNGTHSLEFIGTSPGVAVDLVLLLTDSSCVPTGVGANCTQSTPPTTSITNLTSKAEVYGSSFAVNTTDTANNGGSISSVSLLIDNSSVQTLTTSPFNFNLNTLQYGDGSHILTVNSTDNQGAVGTDTFTVYVSNGDLNLDGKVNISDLAIMAGNWDKTGQTYDQGDINGDGKVSIQDLAVMATNWGMTGL